MLVASHQEIRAGGQRALQDSVIVVMRENIRESDRWSHQRSERVDFGEGFPHLGLRPGEGLCEHGPQHSVDGRRQKELRADAEDRPRS